MLQKYMMPIVETVVSLWVIKSLIVNAFVDIVRVVRKNQIGRESTVRDINRKEDKMKLKDIKIGQFFTIDNTPSYPKLRTEYGYIDFRDEIKKECEDLSFDLRIMDNEEVLDQVERFGISTLESLNKE